MPSVFAPFILVFIGFRCGLDLLGLGREWFLRRRILRRMCLVLRLSFAVGDGDFIFLVVLARVILFLPYLKLIDPTYSNPLN